MRKVSIAIVSLLLMSLMVLIGACSDDDDEAVYRGDLDSEGVYNSADGDGTDSDTAPRHPVAGMSGDEYESIALDLVSYTDQSLSIGRMIVHTGNMDLKVAKADEALRQIKGVARSLGGYVVSSDWNGDDKENSADISIRIPADSYDEALDLLRGLAVEVLVVSTTSKDVTEEYADLDAQLRNLEATEARYLVLLEKADTVEDILKIEAKIATTRGDIEQAKGRMLYLERTAAMSLIRLRLFEDRLLEVDFVANTIEIEEDNWISFTSELLGGTAPYGYRWDFGNGDTSAGSNPRIRYADPGKYTVSLTVTDAEGDTFTQAKESYIIVADKPGWSASNTADSAWGGLVAFGRGFTDVVIWLGILSPIWIIVGLAVYLILRRQRKHGSRHPEA